MTDFRNNTSVKGSRGLRNNNPGNLKDSGIAWKGYAGRSSQGDVIFDSVENGLRAMATDIVNDQKIDGLKTVQLLINEYAPASDGNNPILYAQTVAQFMGLGANDTFQFTEANLAKMMHAITRFELGNNYSGYITDGMITTAIGSMSSGILAWMRKNIPGGVAGGAIILVIAAFTVYSLSVKKKDLNIKYSGNAEVQPDAGGMFEKTIFKQKGVSAVTVYGDCLASLEPVNRIKKPDAHNIRHDLKPIL